MRKIKKLKLNELSIEELKQLKGGTTQGEMDNLIDSGRWYGGVVDGLGYVGPSCVVTADAWSEGRITGDEFELILTAAVAGGEIGSSFGPIGAAAGLIIGGGAATYASYNN